MRTRPATTRAVPTEETTMAETPDDDPELRPRASLSLITRAEHANAFGTVHGGVVLRLADECGALAALHHARGLVITTAAVDAFSFLSPIQIAERLEALAELTYVGRTSLEARVEVFSEPFADFKRRKVAEGYLVYVAIDREGRPTQVAPLPSETEADRRRDEAARARHAHRLSRRSEPAG